MSDNDKPAKAITNWASGGPDLGLRRFPRPNVWFAVSPTCRRDRLGGCGNHDSIWPEGPQCRVAQGNPSGSYDYGLPA